MQISKTTFKEYTRCNRVYPLEDIYFHKLNRDTRIFNDEDYETTMELLAQMFDEESGEDLLDSTDPQMDAMQTYYKDVEKWAIEVAKKEFGLPFVYYENTKDQNYFSFKNQGNHLLYCYLDGFCESENDVYVIEVKATTSKKFQKLGFTHNKINYHLFEKHRNVYQLQPVKDPNISNKYQTTYQNLFDRYHECGKYVFDIAVERYIIENSIHQSNNDLQKKRFHYYLALLNGDYVFDGNYINNEPYYQYSKDNALISFVDLTDITSIYLPKIEEINQQLNEIILNNTLYNEKIGNYCELSKPTTCFFSKLCWKKLKDIGSIMEYMASTNFHDENNKKISKFDLINDGLIYLNSIPKSWLKNPNQRIQRECFDNKQEFINREKIRKGIELIKYPIYHFDFESFPCPLPRFKGESPYSQSLFQFSIHIEKERGKCDINNDHYSFLAKDFNDHRRELVLEMIRLIDLSKDGTVLVYNSSFESTRIKELIALFPEYKTPLAKILEHIFDLMDILKSNSYIYQQLGFSEEESKTINYYHNDLCGKFSIKKVLPLFSDLSYSVLNVKNGTEAIATYGSFKYLPKEDINKLREDLITYCRLDTWSMVMILNNIIKRM